MIIELNEKNFEENLNSQHLDISQGKLDNYVKILERHEPILRRIEKKLKAYDKWIRSSVGDRPMMKILPEDIEKLAQTMADQNKSPATINHIIISLQKLFRYALEREYITGKNPVKLVTKLKTDKYCYILDKSILLL